jgi:deoxycytidine triphosphate deaminase
MPLLEQEEIEVLLRGQPPLIDNFDAARLGTPNSPVRGASLDLAVGEIFIPGAPDGKLGGSDRGKQNHGLESGETAVIRTAEILRLPGDVAAIGFPPSTAVSLAGLLTTNPGHVDPGYQGPLHLTVINMGKEVFTLSRGHRIMRLMLFRLHAAQPVLMPTASPISEELLARLSPDFLNVRDRVSTAIETAGWRLQARSAFVPIVVAIVTAFGAFVLNYWFNVQQMKLDIGNLQAKLDAIGSKVDFGTIDERLKSLEARLPKTTQSGNRAGGTKP